MSGMQVRTMPDKLLEALMYCMYLHGCFSLCKVLDRASKRWDGGLGGEGWHGVRSVLSAEN